MNLKQYFYFNNKKYLIRTGLKNGRYILKNRKKVYINKYINNETNIKGGGKTDKVKYKIKIFTDFKY